MRSWIIDKAHSTIGFEVAHMMISKVRGEFDSFTANIEADDLADITNAVVAFQIDATSINTRNRARDKHLRSSDFFDAHHYPEITFESKKITKVDSENYKVIGDLTMRGITNTITFDVVFGGRAIDPSGGEVYGYEAEASLNREDYGLLWNTALETGGVLVGKEVIIKVDLELKKENVKEKSGNLQIQSSNDPRENPSTTSTEFQQLIAENLTDLVALIDDKGIINYITPSVKSVLNYDVSSFQQRNFIDMIHPDERGIVRNELSTQANRMIKNIVNSEFRIRHRNGDYIPVDADIISTNEQGILLVVMRDIGERKEAEQAIYQLAFHDSLTELPNRRSFLNQLRSEVMDRKFTKSKLSVLFIDLDDFKPINDTWGHDAGDIVLKESANRIHSVIRPTDIAARFGGDEFVVLLKDVQDEKDAITVAERLLEQFERPITKGNQAYSMTPSIGVAHYPSHGNSPEELIKNADTALYYVKERGKNNFMVFNELMEHQSLERQILENALKQGIKEQQFYMEYQPKVYIKTNEVIGMEALVRWKRPELGIISPGKFIPLAEETGLIVPLGEWILRESSRQAAVWQDTDYSPLILSVNISVRQLEDFNFVDKLKKVLQETGLDPSRLELEITESVLANIKSTVSVLKEVRKLGVLISVDDFGTGYSSLSYIKELPIDTIKIDQSFVKDIHTNKESKEIAKALINLANSIGLNAIAEGIELEEHVDELSEDGYILGQGFYYSRPLKPEAFEDYVKGVNEVS